MYVSVSEITFPKKLTRWSVYPATMVIIIGLLVLLGWEFNVEGHLVAMNPASAVAFVFAGSAFLLLKRDAVSQQLAGKILAILVLLTGLLRFIAVIGGFDIHIDSLLFSGKLMADPSGKISNHMTPNTAFSFILTGTALLLQKIGQPRHQKAVHGIALAIALIGFFSMLGYLYRVQAFYGVLRYIPMAIHTSICFLLLSAAILLKEPEKGIMKDFTGQLAGSVTARRLIPAAIILPVILGFLRLLGHWAGLFATEFGVTILVLSIIIVFLLMIWYNAILLNKKDLLKQEAEKALRQSEEQVQTIFNAAPDAVIVIDEKGKIVKWNPKAETMFGWTEAEIAGKLLAETIIPNRYRDAHRKGMNRFLQTGEGPVLGKTIEVQAINKGGHEFDVALSISPTRMNNTYLFIGFLRDITEQKKARVQLQKSEEKFQKAFQVSAAGITITHLSTGIYLEVNDAFVKMVGYTKEEIIGHTSTELGLITDPGRREELLHQIREQGSAKNFEMPIRHKSGKLVEVLASVETILLNDEKYAINVIYDITDRKKAEKELEAVNKELEAFSYSVSHDLRAPLRTIDGYTNIVAEDYTDKLDPEGKRLLGIIASSAQKMGQLIDDLLNFSRLGRKELSVRHVDMTDIVTSIIAEQQLLKPTHATIQVEKLQPAYCDSNLIKQVWVNLISNAIKYSSQREKPVIEIRSGKTTDEIIYSIQDNGAGFDMRYADKLFGVFQRLHNIKEFEGTGVGLALAQRIINRHGGRVWAEAELNKGATFHFSLPILRDKTTLG